MEEFLKIKADLSELRDLVSRQNTLEDYVHKRLDKSTKKDRDIT